MLGHSPTEAFQVDVVGEMLTEFQEQAGRRLRLDNSSMRIYDLILGSADDQVQLAKRLEEVVGRLWVVQAERREVDVELEALWSSVTRV
jgi:IMP dehydrogenase/GMP reductase